MTEKIQHTLIIPAEFGGMRLDQALVKLLPQYSRTQLQDWIKNSAILVDTKKVRAKHIVFGGESIQVNAHRKQYPLHEPQNIHLDIIFEDEDVLVINKPVGMVVHPAAGNPNSTLLNALLHHAPNLHALPRAGIIHRLDKNTSGLLIIAKSQTALFKLSQQLKKHAITRIYQAIVNGLMTSGGTVDKPIARHPIQRKQMAVLETGKPSVTHYRLIEKYRAHTRIKVQLETGRTHQIRVHMASIHYPLLGDPVYGGRLQLPKGATEPLIVELRRFKHQALHASELHFTHPITQEEIHCQAPLPDDMQDLISILKEDNDVAKNH